MKHAVWTSEAIDALWEYDDPEQSETRFREAIALGAGDEARTQVARALGLRRKFDWANAELDQIDLNRASDLLRARVALERGRVLNSSGQPELARPFFEEALKLAEAAGESFYAVDAAHMLGIVCPGDEGLEWNLRAIQMVEDASDKRAKRWLGSLLNNTGWSLHAQGRLDEALALFEKALAFRSLQGDAKTIQIARWCVARCVRSLGRIEESLAMQRDLLRLDPRGGYVHEEMGECLYALGKTKEAAVHFRKAHEILSLDPWLTANEPARLTRLKELGGEDS